MRLFHNPERPFGGGRYCEAITYAITTKELHEMHEMPETVHKHNLSHIQSRLDEFDAHGLRLSKGWVRGHPRH